jgi:hypothetical protein
MNGPESRSEFWRSVSTTLLDRRPELAVALAEQSLTGRALVDILVARGLISANDLYEAVVPIEQETRPSGLTEAARADQGTTDPTPIRPEPAREDTVVYMLPRIGTYALVERDGPVPTRGETIEVDGSRFLVARVGRSPLPSDDRACVYLTHGR